MSRIILSHPTGNANVRAALESFETAGMLEAFCTGVGLGVNNHNPVSKKLLKRRQFPIPSKKVNVVSWREHLRLLTQQLGIRFGNERELGYLCIDRVYRDVDRAAARIIQRTKKPINAIYCYEDGALESFRAAKALKISCIYDLPIGYWRAARQIQKEEAELKPEWAVTMPALSDSNEKLERKDAELRLADQIIVASKFTAETLKAAPFPIKTPLIIPYGCPPVSAKIKPLKRERNPKSNPLRVLYVGSLSQRKGISYLLDAVRNVGRSVELTIIGRRVAECAPIDAAISENRWIESAPHTEILNEMQNHDVLVFPSLFEGFGLVITEALSQGIPVITTKNTCGPDVISDGIDGYIVPIRDAPAITESLMSLHKDRERLHAMKTNAIKKSSKLTWDLYRITLANSVSKVLIDHNGKEA